MLGSQPSRSSTQFSWWPLSSDVGLDDAVLNATKVATAHIVESPLAVYKGRPWGHGFAGGFTRAIQDLATTGLFKPGPCHDIPPSANLFAESWLRLV